MAVMTLALDTGIKNQQKLKHETDQSVRAVAYVTITRQSL